MQQDAAPPESTASGLARSLSDPAFLAAVCHDLRGPLGAIGTWIHVLASGKADAATQHQALSAIERDVLAQSHLIEQLADLSSILGGTLQVSIEEVDLDRALGELGATLLSHASSSVKLLADPVRLRQLLAILLHTDRDGPGASGPGLTTERKEPGLHSIRGITRKGGPRLVGLTLARALAEVQGGHLTISAATEGTVFEIALPASEPPKGER